MSDSNNTIVKSDPRLHDQMTDSTTEESDEEFAAEMVRRARHLIDEDRHEDAERYLRQALERVPDHNECQAYIAVCLAGKRKFVSAEKLAKNVVKNNPFDAIAYYALGRVNLIGSRRGSAFRNLEKARTLACGDSDMEVEVNRLDPRRPSVIRWLPRNHFLNIMFGKMRSAMKRGGSN